MIGDEIKQTKPNFTSIEKQITVPKFFDDGEHTCAIGAKAGQYCPFLMNKGFDNSCFWQNDDIPLKRRDWKKVGDKAGMLIPCKECIMKTL